ncbi:MAG: hypothetical protein K0R98_716 [Rickettsiaceae bacterium]|jgi:hypothetical protein|nr:hypothetical protein [Rickettsiaceae bacterium]
MEKTIKSFFIIICGLFITAFMSTELPEVSEPKQIELSRNNSHKVYFENINSILGNQEIGTSQGGFLCVYRDKLIWENHLLMNEVLGDAIKKEISNYLSITQNKKEASIIISADISNIWANFCTYNPNGSKGDAAIEVAWKMYSKTNKNSLNVKTIGKGSIPDFIKTADPDLWKIAVTNATRHLLSNAELKQLVSY